MHHSFARLLAYASEEETLYAGEILGSGTVGDGCGLERLLERPREIKGRIGRQSLWNEGVDTFAARARDLVAAGSTSIHWGYAQENKAE